MAIRRVSDLPELATTYPSDFDNEHRLSNLQKCLVEVSYNHSANMYQSFYTTVKNVLDIASDTYVTLAGDQTIVGAKTFTSQSGISVDSGNGYNGSIRGITMLSSDIDSSSSTINNDLMPAPIAIKDYINYVFGPYADMLCSLISEKNGDYYVDYVNGRDDFNNSQCGVSPEYPFKTLSAAVKKMNMRRFIGNAQATIHLQSDYVPSSDTDPSIYDTSLSGPAQIIIYHPDMVQNRYVTIVGDGAALTKLSSDASKILESGKTWIRCQCNVKFRHCQFSNGIAPIFDNIYGYSEPKTSAFYTIGSTNNAGEVDLSSCYFLSCYYAVVANHIRLQGYNRFKLCDRALYTVNGASGRTEIQGIVLVDRCGVFLYASLGSISRYTNSPNISYLMCRVGNTVFSATNGSTILVDCNNKKDLNSDNDCIVLQKFIEVRPRPALSTDFVYLSTDMTESSMQNFYKDTFGGISHSGYSENGYLKFSYNTEPSDWLSGYVSNHKCEWSDVSANMVRLAGSSLGITDPKEIDWAVTGYPDPNSDPDISWST